MSCIGETADSRTSATRLDFSSTVMVISVEPLIMTDIISRSMKATGRKT